MNFIERLQSKLDIKNYIFRKENLIIELNDATYQLNLNTKIISHVDGRYSELIHNNLIKEFYHFYYGSFASGVGSLIYINSSVKSPLKGRLLVSFGSAFVAGLGKELYDSRAGGSGFDVADLGATVLGAMPINIVFTLDKLDKNKKTKVKRKYRY